MPTGGHSSGTGAGPPRNALPETDGTRANIWQGDFPHTNTKADGWERTAPFRSYPPNGYGLHDMGGNGREWCRDWYRPDAYLGLQGVTVNSQGPGTSWDQAEPLAQKRVTRGGSFLCHTSTCESYRPARRGRRWSRGCRTWGSGA